MSPAIAQAGSASKDVKKESATARLLGSGKFVSLRLVNCSATKITHQEPLELRSCWFFIRYEQPIR